VLVPVAPGVSLTSQQTHKPPKHRIPSILIKSSTRALEHSHVPVGPDSQLSRGGYLFYRTPADPQSCFTPATQYYHPAAPPPGRMAAIQNQHGTGSRRGSQVQLHNNIQLNIPARASTRPRAPSLTSRPQDSGGARKPSIAHGGDVVFIDLTASSIPQAAQAPTTGTMAAIRDNDPRARDLGGDGGTGIAGAQGPLDPPPPARATVLNSRHKRRLGFGGQAHDASTAAPPMPFVSPSTIQPASRGPATPTTSRGPIGSRQRQFKPQTSKPAVVMSASKRDTRPKPYVLETPSMAPIYPSKSR